MVVKITQYTRKRGYEVKGKLDIYNFKSVLFDDSVRSLFKDMLSDCHNVKVVTKNYYEFKTINNYLKDLLLEYTEEYFKNDVFLNMELVKYLTECWEKEEHVDVHFLELCTKPNNFRNNTSLHNNNEEDLL